MTVPYTFANQTGAIPLAELDANFAAIPNYANTAGTVTSPSQVNITSVGVLNSLSVAGAVNVTGFVTATNLFTENTVIALGPNTGKSNVNTINIGNLAGNLNQAGNTIALGPRAGEISQSANSIAIGRLSGSNAQGIYSLAIGWQAGFNLQDSRAVAIGTNAGSEMQSANAVALGLSAGSYAQGGNAIAIGAFAGNTSQGIGGIAIGRAAANLNQGSNAVAIGRSAGNLNQGMQAIAFGHQAGNLNQGTQAIAIGAFAGNNAQGSNAIAIGSYAGNPISAANSICINGTAGNLSAPYSGLFIAPINNDTSNITNVMYYNTTTSEITYGPVVVNNYGNSNVAAYLPTYTGNISANYFSGDGSLLTNINAGNISGAYGNANVATYLPTYTGNLSGSNVLVTGVVSAGGNVRGANINTAGIVSATGNVHGDYFIGNGSQLTGVATTNSRVNVTITTASLASNTAANIVATGFKGYSLYSITSDAPSWVTLYTSNAAAVSDYTRTISTDPTPGSGVIAESILYTSGTTNFTPAVVGFNNETVPTTAIPLKVYNTGSTSNIISVTLTLLKLEG